MKSNQTYRRSRQIILYGLLALFFSLQSCISTFLIPEKMEKNELGRKIESCVNQDEAYMMRQFGEPTKTKKYDNGTKMVYYEEWGHFDTERWGNTQYYTDRRFIKFEINPEGYVEDYYASKGYEIEYDKNETTKNVVFWAEIIGYVLVGGAIGVL